MVNVSKEDLNLLYKYVKRKHKFDEQECCSIVNLVCAELKVIPSWANKIGYIKILVNRQIIDEIRKAKVREKAYEEFYLNKQVEVPDELYEFIDRLPKQYKKVISLIYFDNVKNKDVAVMLGKTPGAISYIHNRAILELKKMFKQLE